MIDAAAVRNWSFPELRQTYTARDTVLYNLALGYGSDPALESELRFVFERDLVAMPTMSVALCHPGFWISHPGTGIDATKAVHGEQDCRFERPLPAEGTVVAHVRVTSLVDKGAGKGALVVTERTLTDAATGELLATLEQRTLCRGDGGFEASPAVSGSERGVANNAPADHTIDLATSPQAALLYRQIADPNPLHADPAIARAAGFPRPILHGLCSYGIAARAVLRACRDGDPHALKRLGVRFSAPLYPGETLRTEVWRGGTPASANARFRCTALERGVVVMSNGIAEFH